MFSLAFGVTLPGTHAAHSVLIRSKPSFCLLFLLRFSSFSVNFEVYFFLCIIFPVSSVGGLHIFVFLIVA